ncbi:hypothetical protein N7492_005591, partial [Penicillium capsulatum]
MDSSRSRPYGYRWRTSKLLILSTACIALLTETLLYGFLVPILPYMLEDRLHMDPANTQSLTATLLSMHGLIPLVSAPVIANIVDRIGSRQRSLLVSLVVCLIGTFLVALSRAFWALCLGRGLQAIAGSGAWIVCLAILAENAGKNDVGKMMGVAMSFVMSGTVGGPIIAGALLEWLGYWPTWAVPLGILLFDSIVRAVIIEPSFDRDEDHLSPSSLQKPDNSEDSPLLPETNTPHLQCRGFYKTMLCDMRVWGSLVNTGVYSAIVAGFNTTLPVHLRTIFGWGPLEVGSIFFLLQLPLIFLSPLSGWLRDRVGLRLPTALGWALLVPLLLGLGIPGSHLVDALSLMGEKAIFISSTAGIGIALPLIQGAGALNSLGVLREIEIETPGIFGAQGGRSRAFAMNSVTFNTGLMLGPLISGTLSSVIGYFYMSVAQGKESAISIALPLSTDHVYSY